MSKLFPKNQGEDGKKAAARGRTFFGRRKKNKYDFEGHGRAAVARFSMAFALIAIVYVVLHWYMPASEQGLRVREFISVAPTGIVAINSPEDIDWYVGPEKSKPILSAINLRNQEIANTYGQLREAVSRFTSESPGPLTLAVGELLTAVEQGCVPSSGSVSGSDCVPASAQITALARRLDHLAALIHRVSVSDSYNWAWLDELRSDVHLVTLRAQSIPGEVGERRAVQQAVMRLNDTFANYVSRGPRLTRLQKADAQDSIQADAQRFQALADEAAVNGKELVQMATEFRREIAVVRGWLSRRDDALMAFDRFVGRIAGSRATSSALLVDLRQHTSRLVALRRAQFEAVDTLRPPVKLSIFWMTPQMILVEVAFWGMFGVLTNLLLHMAEAVKNGTYAPAEMIIHGTKLIYGPVLALVLCLAILTGLVQLVGYEVRAWALPLVSFLFGFNARKTAALADRWSEKIFGAVGVSIDDGPKAIAAARADLLASYMQLMKPGTLAELRSAAHHLAIETVQNVVLHNEARS